MSREKLLHSLIKSKQEVQCLPSINVDVQRNQTQGIHCMGKKIIKVSEKGSKFNTESCVWTLLDVITVW